MTTTKKWAAATVVAVAACVSLASTAKAQHFYPATYVAPVHYNYAVPYSYNYTPVVPVTYNYAVPIYPNYGLPTYSYQDRVYSTPYSYGYYGTRYQSPSMYGPGGYSYRYYNRFR